MNDDSIERPVRVGLISLGCAKNLVDAEVMVGTLLKDGVEITNDTAQADVVIVNTCSFIDSAQEESVEILIAELRDARTVTADRSGRLPYASGELPKLLPEVDVLSH
jgi:ribosomal protein S12 methylthiotransferase